MNQGFWGKLKKPFFVMAPMADVTDPAFRQIVAKYGKPDVTYTEFVSSDGLMHPDATERLKLDLRYEENERPIVAQLFSSNPENMKQSAKLARELGFDGIDINMGCPDRSIQKQLAGAALIRHPDIAKEVILAAKEGAGDLPVSVKTRLGYSSLEEFDAWVDAIVEAQPVAITMHLRTRQEMSKVPAHWDYAGRLAEKLKGTGILAIANGDVKDLDDAKEKAEKYGVDGVMIGRGIYGNPWLFTGKKREDVPIEERVRVMVEHAYLYEEKFEGQKSFALMKKFFKSYVQGHPKAKDFQKALMETNSAEEVEKVVSGFML